MKLEDAKREIQRAGGFRVHFERRANGMLSSDYFPDRTEDGLPLIGQAWELAEQWSKVNPCDYVNIYVVHANDWTPVDGYRSKTLNKYPPPPMESPDSVDAVRLSVDEHDA